MKVRTAFAMTAAGVLTAALAVASAAQTPPPGRGQNPPQTKPPAQAALGTPDSEFINKAAKAGAEEVDLAQLAIKTSKNPAIIAAANKIKTDHETANKQLMSIAKSKHHTPPALTNAEKQQAHGKIMSLKGTDFDKEWVSMMIAGHNEAIALFTGASSSTDAEIAAFAKKTLPTLQDHLKTVQAINVTFSSF